MSNNLSRRCFLKGAVTTGAMTFLSMPVSAARADHHWFTLCPWNLAGAVTEGSYLYGETRTEKLESQERPARVTVFHTGSTGWVGVPAWPVPAHNFLCDTCTAKHALQSGYRPVPGRQWWEETEYPAFHRGFQMMEGKDDRLSFVGLVESYNTAEHPVRAAGIALINCVLDDPSARAAAVPAAAFAHAAGYRTFALVSLGADSLSADVAKQETLERLTSLSDGVLTVSLREVLDTCGESDPAEWELCNQAEFLCRLAEVIANSADHSHNVSTTDVTNWLSRGGSVRLARITIPHNFRNDPRPPLEYYAKMMVPWFDGLMPNDRCLIFSPPLYHDRTSLVGLAERLRNHAETRNVDGCMLALQGGLGIGETIGLLALRPAFHAVV